MKNYEEIAALGEQMGFSRVGRLAPGTIELKQDVRAMCQKNACGMYDRNWSCPPGCGSLEDCRNELSGYTQGILVQTIGELEDEFEEDLDTSERGYVHLNNAAEAVKDAAEKVAISVTINGNEHKTTDGATEADDNQIYVVIPKCN